MTGNNVRNRNSCSICLETFKNPKILQCFHTFCAHCLNDLILGKRQEGAFECPLCRTNITIPKKGIDGFQNNFYVQDQVIEEFKSLCNDRKGDTHVFHDTKRIVVGETYNVVLSCCYNGGRTSQCIVQVIDTVPIKCTAPKATTRPSYTSVILTWECHSNNGCSSITQYRVKMFKVNKTDKEVYIGSNTLCELDNLSPGMKYSFAVQAQNIVGWGPWSDVLEVTLDPCPPGTPKDFGIEDTTSSTVTLTWTEADDNGTSIMHYVIKYNAEDECNPISVNTEPTVFMHVLDNLIPGTKYCFKIYAVNSIGEGQCSKTLQCKTVQQRLSQVRYENIQRSRKPPRHMGKADKPFARYEREDPIYDFTETEKLKDVLFELFLTCFELFFMISATQVPIEVFLVVIFIARW